jgi:hypothetical protein
VTGSDEVLQNSGQIGWKTHCVLEFDRGSGKGFGGEELSVGARNLPGFALWQKVINRIGAMKASALPALLMLRGRAKQGRERIHE